MANYIPLKIKCILWGKASGRCQYRNCSEILYRDPTTESEFNTAYIAHIIADKPDGPRGDPKLSRLLNADISNLMLLCDCHHRLIDKENVAGHPVELLKTMKAEHENRIEIQTEAGPNGKSKVILYGANIGKQNSPLSWGIAKDALLPDRYPEGPQAIEIGMKNSSFRDDDNNFWFFEREHLHNQFRDKIRPLFDKGDFNHYSIFALAPQPLLMEFGRLIGEIQAADVFQLKREPSTWKWLSEQGPDDFTIKKPLKILPTIAINLSLSADISNDRITKILGEDVSIWTITIGRPNNDFLKSKNQLKKFREITRNLFNQIKAIHGQDSVLHIFPALPVSCAVEFGRCWMPKADLPLIIYDQNQKLGGFVKTLEINANN